uniref:Uncharacterized protein n=1 Tax=Rhizophora mucronata TaxID=61149 RepID=A0A2P2QM57_RHIMU
MKSKTKMPKLTLLYQIAGTPKKNLLEHMQFSTSR